MGIVTMDVQSYHHLNHRVLLVSAAILFTFLCISCQDEDVFLEMHLDRCLDGVEHKDKPGPESDLFKHCSPWNNRSCCTEQIAKDLHLDETWYNFSFCGEMSQECEKYNRQDICFYQCSPNVGPWLEPQSKTTRNEHFVDLPLCRSQCNLWFEACKDDKVCVENWGAEFVWGNDGSQCPENAPCRTFKEFYGTADDMCEKIWGDSFKVTSDDEPCMVLWFEGDVNPNDEVARMKAEELYAEMSRADKTAVLHKALIVFTTLFTSMVGCIL